MSTAPPAPEPLGRNTELSFERSRLAADRTLMSSIRTALSLIGFGFTIFKFFQYLHEQDGLTELPEHGPRNLGLALLLLGVALLVISIAQHMLFMRRMTRERGERFVHSPALAAAMALLVIGLLALSNVVLRIGPF